jgi:hypothetical protein
LIGAERERAQPATGPAFTDAVTFAFGDPDAQVYGLARLGLSPAGASALAILFAGGEPVAALARGGAGTSPDAGWDALRVEGLATRTDAPLERWAVVLEHEGHGFDLAFTALTPPAALSREVERAGGMAGYEQLCAVSGTVRTGGRVHQVHCLGQRGHSWGEADWERVERVRTLCAWSEAGPAFAMTAIRRQGEGDHAGESVWAVLLDGQDAVEIDRPRVTTTYDADGRQRRAGLELWVAPDDDFPHGGSGSVLCGSTMELGQLRLDCAFFRWTLDGRPAVGRYDVLRRAG